MMGGMPAHLELQPPEATILRPAAAPVRGNPARGNMVRGAAGSRLMGPWLGKYARVGDDPPPVLSDDEVGDDDPGTPMPQEGESQFLAGPLYGMKHTSICGSSPVRKPLRSHQV
jgi:hypothetical protein